MTEALSYEWERLRTLRSTWLLALGSVLATALAAYGYTRVVAGVQSTGATVDRLEAVVLVVSRPSFAPVVAGIVGVFAIGSEFRHGTMRTTLLVTPQRTSVLAAKATVVGGYASVLALANLAVAWGVGSLGLRGSPSLVLSAQGLLQLTVGQVLLVVGWALIGLAVTVLVRSQLAGLAVLLAVPYVVEPMVGTTGMIAGHGWLERVAGHLPFSAGEAMTDVSARASGTLLTDAAVRIGPVTGGLIFYAVIAALGLSALLVYRTQDV